MKMPIRVILQEQSAPEPGLHTLLTDVEGILNAKLLRSTLILEWMDTSEQPLSRSRTRPTFDLSPFIQLPKISDAEDHQVICFLSKFKCLQNRLLRAAVRKPYSLRTSGTA